MKTSHSDQVEEWATYIKNNPDKWREQHTLFVNSQIIMAREALGRIKQQKNGKQKIIEMFGIKNNALIEKL